MSKLKALLKPRSICGFIIIAVALLILFENLGIDIFHKVLGNWPLALIIIGCAMIYGSPKEGGAVLPYIFIGFGVLFLLEKYDVFNIHWEGFIFPVVLLLLGIYLLKPFLLKQRGEVGLKNEVDVFSVLGSGEFNTRSRMLNTGNVVCILGGANVDMRDAEIEAESMEIDVFCFMGGVEIKIPTHWRVSVKAVPLLGGVTDQTVCMAEKMQLSAKSLVVNGFALMGGIEIKN